MSAAVTKLGACVPNRAGVTPFLAAHLHGYKNFKWMLYGDDDTVFFIDNALDMLEGLDHNMPYFLTDHLWFPDQFGNSSFIAVHVCLLNNNKQANRYISLPPPPTRPPLQMRPSVWLPLASLCQMLKSLFLPTWAWPVLKCLPGAYGLMQALSMPASHHIQ